MLILRRTSNILHYAGSRIRHARLLSYYSFNEDELAAKDLARSWARGTLLDKVRSMDKAGMYDEKILKDLFQYGFMGMEIPEKYGGSGMNFASACLVVEEISRVDPSVAILVDIQNTLTNNAIRFWGSDDLKQKWLPRLAVDTISSFALSENGSGSDAFAMKTVATKSRDGETYIINGSKLWISNSREAGVILTFAKTDPSKGYKGVSAFLVDTRSDGVKVGPPESKLGLKASSTCPVTFDDVIVPKYCLLGEEGMGYKYCINILNEGRIGIAAQQVGIAKGCLDIVLPYIKEREQFGKVCILPRSRFS